MEQQNQNQEQNQQQEQNQNNNEVLIQDEQFEQEYNENSSNDGDSTPKIKKQQQRKLSQESTTTQATQVGEEQSQNFEEKKYSKEWDDIIQIVLQKLSEQNDRDLLKYIQAENIPIFENETNFEAKNKQIQPIFLLSLLPDKQTNNNLLTIYYKSDLKSKIYNQDIINYCSSIFNIELDEITLFEEVQEKSKISFKQPGYIYYRCCIMKIDNIKQQEQGFITKLSPELEKERQIQLQKQNELYADTIIQALYTVLKVGKSFTEFLINYFDKAWEEGDQHITEDTEQFCQDVLNEEIIDQIEDLSNQQILEKLVKSLEDYNRNKKVYKEPEY